VFLADRAGTPFNRILIAAWRAALDAATDDPATARAALKAVIR
jgi:hypothetical protein